MKKEIDISLSGRERKGMGAMGMKINDYLKKGRQCGKIICPICETPMDFLEEWDSNLKMTKCYKCDCSNCESIL